MKTTLPIQEVSLPKEPSVRKSFRQIAVDGGFSNENTLKMYDALEKWIKKGIKIPDDIRRKMRQVRILNQQNKLILETRTDDAIHYTEFLILGLVYEGFVERRWRPKP